MKITKMHGLGNDFILIDHRCGGIPEEDLESLAKKLCARRLNVGADGLILVENSDKAAIRMRIFNADGSEAEMCGNGIRCFARFVYDEGIVREEEFTVETLAGIMVPKMLLCGDTVVGVRVNMGKPDFSPAAIPMNAPEALRQKITVAGEEYEISSVRMGVPHTVVFLPPDTEDFSIAERIGGAIEKHPLFPEGTNVNFAVVTEFRDARVRTWERGAGVTLACGTGSCAVACVMKALGIGKDHMVIELAAGSLLIEQTEEAVYMTGPAEYVLRGETAED